MQVFKSYFKILNRHMGQMIMYLSIFIGIMVVLTATRTNKAEGDYEAAKPKFAVFDYDKSSESKALTEYLKKTCIKKNIKNDKKETMQDELFARNVNCVLIIKEGFSLDVVTIPGTQAATTFESAINSFTKTYNTYIASGYSEADALAAVNTSLSQKASVSATQRQKCHLALRDILLLQLSGMGAPCHDDCRYSSCPSGFLQKRNQGENILLIL